MVEKATSIIKIPVTLEIPIGPQHPALHEPVLLKIYADGEEVVGVEIGTGYNHRGIEKLLENNTFYKGKFIASRVCGICNAVHENCFVRAVEYLVGMKPSPRAEYLRVLVMELERLHSHMLINAIMAEIIGFDTLFMYIMRDRELVMKAKEIVAGNRVSADFHMFNGVRRDIDDVKRDKLIDLLRRVEPRLKYYRKLFEDDPTISKRLTEIGVLKAKDVTSYGMLGPVLRGSGIKSDARAEDRYDAYNEIPFNVVVRGEGDSLARMLVRWDEALESLEMCKYILEHLPSGPAAVDERKLPRTFPAGESFARVEAPRGELTYYIQHAGGNKPYRVKVRTPSLNNIINSGFSYLGHSVADVPVILVSYDPCISCMERAIIVDLKNKVEKRATLREIAMKEVRL
ncbi:MAG: nickel-dependent hydrogenase large subunit [Ignisphaera sp.]|nr:nickel-dependent hydrogenase large subunit [Ignisphaera sp.]MCX8167881.1 nickel-dependent hydrogenase large subunit [Ignisphaera sp.]